jgi:hypothetical protein
MASQHASLSGSHHSDTLDPTIIDWLLAGDPAIAWHTERDLLDAPRATWEALRARTLREGWGGRLLALQNADGGWDGGIYSPKWTSATYTLLSLCDIGIPPTSSQAQRGARYVLSGLVGEQVDVAFATRLAACDRCIVGMLLRIGACFVVDDPRIPAIVENLLAERMADGGWNCRRHRRPRPTHSSFHTTLNVLEGIRVYLESSASAYQQELQQAEIAALELLLEHKLYRSDKTGAVIREEWTHPVYPYRWHYDVLRALEHFARAGAPRDPRLGDAVALLEQRRQADGRWLRGKVYTGREFFTMEPAGPSRWNTLRALRVLRWWYGERADETGAG